MARPDRDGRGPAKRWREAALGGALVALGGALFGVSRGSVRGGAKRGDKPSGKEPGQAGKNKGGARPDPKSRPTVSRAKVRTKPNRPEVASRTQYWPPPPPKPLDVYDDGIQPPEQAVRNTQVPVDASAVKRGYEAGDDKPGTIVKVLLGSACAVACAIAVLFVLVSWRGRDARQAPPLTPQQLAVIVPPGPRLQDHPIHDIAMENKRETDLLSFYAWSGPDHRSGRIPIDRAEALVIGRPLDPLPSPAPQPAGGPAAPPTGPAPVPAQNP